MLGDLPRGKSQTALAWGLDDRFINARSVIKTVTTTQAWARRDSDAFILPDYIHGCAFRSHHGHTSGYIRARSPLGPVLLLVFWKRVRPSGPSFVRLFYSPFFYSGGLCVVWV